MATSERGSVKVVELIGESDESWEAAAQQALDDASETIDGISGVDIVNQTAKVENNEIVQYRTTVHLAFPVQR
ncbi:MAG: dodecin family protein [Halobacteriota archaeon]